MFPKLKVHCHIFQILSAVLLSFITITSVTEGAEISSSSQNVVVSNASALLQNTAPQVVHWTYGLDGQTGKHLKQMKQKEWFLAKNWRVCLRTFF